MTQVLELSRIKHNTELLQRLKVTEQDGAGEV
jgi:hypothetical protein